MAARRRYRYLAVDSLSGELIDGAVRFKAPAWSRHVAGGGEFSGSIAAPARDDTRALDRLKRVLAPNTAIYVENISTGQYVWGGPVAGYEWNGTDVSIKAREWRSWFFAVPLVPDAATGGNFEYTWSGVDQTTIASDAVGFVLAEPGSPSFGIDAPATGRLRDYTTHGTEMKSAGEVIQALSERIDGFEWNVELSRGVDGLPVRTVRTWYPQRGLVIPGLRFELGRNVQSYGPVSVDYEAGATRVWAIGAGTTPAVTFAVDQAPDIATKLRREQARRYNNVASRSVLAGKAQKVRQFLGVGMETLDISAPLAGRLVPDADDYDVGDRCTLRIKDRLVDLNYAAVRIVSKEVSTGGSGSVKLTLDLSDLSEPETDEGAP